MNYLYKIESCEWLLLTDILHDTNNIQQLLDIQVGQQLNIQIQFIAKVDFDSTQLKNIAIAQQFLFNILPEFSQSSLFSFIHIDQFQYLDFLDLAPNFLLKDLFPQLPNLIDMTLFKKFHSLLQKPCQKIYGDEKILKLCFIGQQTTTSFINSSENQTFIEFYQKKYNIKLQDELLCYCLDLFAEDLQPMQCLNCEEYLEYIQVHKNQHYILIPISLLKVFDGNSKQIPNILKFIPKILNNILDSQKFQRSLTKCQVYPFKFWQIYDMTRTQPIQYLKSEDMSIFYNAYQKTSQTQLENSILQINSDYEDFIKEKLNKQQFNIKNFEILNKQANYRQRLEFLGDAVVGYIITEALVACGEKYMQLKSEFVSNKYFSKIYQNNSEFFQTFVQSINETSNKSNADVVEVFFGMIYLLYGLQYTQLVLSQFIIFDEQLIKALDDKILRFNQIELQELLRIYTHQITNLPLLLLNKDQTHRKEWFYIPDIQSLKNVNQTSQKVEFKQYDQQLYDNAIIYFGLNHIISSDNQKLNFNRAVQLALNPSTYETLEMLGDSFLKLSLSLNIFLKYKYVNEGILTFCRQVSERNDNLSIIIFKKYPYLALKLQRNLQIQQQNKRFGDIYESLIGAIILTLGYEAANYFILKDIQPDIKNLEEKFDLLNLILTQKNDIKLDYYFQEKNRIMRLNETSVIIHRYPDKSLFRLLCQLIVKSSDKQISISQVLSELFI